MVQNKKIPASLSEVYELAGEFTYEEWEELKIELQKDKKEMEEKAKKLASQHWFRQRINVAYCSGAGISYTETLAMMDEEVLAAILIINEIEEKQKNRHNKESKPNGLLLRQRY